MQKFFIYNQQTHMVELNMPEILLIKEFRALVDKDTSKQKTLLFKEITYIHMALSWDSPYAQYSEAERHNEAMLDSGLTEKEFNNPLFRAACRKYRELQDSNKSIRMLNAARSASDQFVDYFENVVDLNERDQNGKPIFTAEKVMKEVTMLNKVHQELVDLESRVKKEMSEQSQIRAGAIEGYEDYED